MVNVYDLVCDNCGVRARVITEPAHTITGDLTGRPSYCPECKIIENNNILRKCKCGGKLFDILNFKPKLKKYGEEEIMKCPLCEKETLRCKYVESYEV